MTSAPGPAQRRETRSGPFVLRICAGPGRRRPAATISSPGHEDGGPERARHAQRRASGGGGEDEVGGREAAARREKERALLEDLSAHGGRARRAAARRRAARCLSSISAASSTGTTASLPGGIGAPVITFHAAPGGSGPVHAARARGARAREERRRLADLRRAHGPAVHRRRVERRKGQVGARRLRRGRVPAAVVERDRDGRERRHGPEHEREGFLERDHGRDR